MSLPRRSYRLVYLLALICLLLTAATGAYEFLLKNSETDSQRKLASEVPPEALPQAPVKGTQESTILLTPAAKTFVSESLLAPSPNPATKTLELAPIPLMQNLERQESQTTFKREELHKLNPEKQQKNKVGLNLYLGLGLNYFQYNEDLLDVSTSYRGFRGPSYNFGTDFQLTEATSVEASYKVTPMYFDNSSVGLTATKEDWQTLILQGSTQSEVFTHITSGEPQKGDLDFRWLYGIQFHQLPLALFENGTNKPTLRLIQLLDASLGAKQVNYLNSTTRTTILGRLQYPLSSGSVSSATLTLKPLLIFDGSVGIEKRLMPSTWLGLHWYGQYQNINFTYRDSLVTAEGKQSAVFSTLELRLLFEY